MKEVLTPQQIDTSIKSPQHLKEWLIKSGREWLVLNAVDWVDALSYPDDHNLFRKMIEQYKAYRAMLPVIGVKRKEETLGIEELDRAIRYLIRQASELDSNWSLENPAL